MPRSGQQPVEVPVLRIHDGTKEIGDSVKVTLGARCRWVVSSDDGAVTDTRWAAMNVVIGDYDPDDDSAAVRPLNIHVGNQANWYWAGQKTERITVSASIGGQKYTRTISVEVRGATIVSFTSRTDAVKVAKLDHGHTEPALTFGGDAISQTAGIVWTANVIAPPSRGHFSFMQLISISRKFTSDKGVSQVTSNGEYVLDEGFHYGIVEPGVDDDAEEANDTIRCLDSEVLQLQGEDSPGTKLQRTVVRDFAGRPAGVYSEAEVSEKYEVYLMYRPDGGIWVALARLRWSWEGVARHDGTNWLLHRSAYTRNPKGKKCVGFPLWKKNRFDIM